MSMSPTDIVIVSAGIVTPVGLSLGESAASARARIARLREIAWVDRQREPFVVGSVPDAGLPELSSALVGKPLRVRETRMLRMAHAALEEALEPLSPALGPVPLLLGLPEHHSAIPLDPGLFLHNLGLQSLARIDLGSSLCAPRGRAGALMALRLARSALATGQHRFMLVGGTDSLVDPYVLGQFDFENRIRNAHVSDGFSPSEGAAFLLLARADTVEAERLPMLARLLACASGNESGHLYAQAPYLGEGLAATFAQLLSPPPETPVGSVFCSFNGERYWAREFGVARTRQTAAFAPDHEMEHPAECFGDLGSAHGAALAALAAHGVQRGYRRTPCLVYASSDRGERAAMLIDRPV